MAGHFLSSQDSLPFFIHVFTVHTMLRLLLVVTVLTLRMTLAISSAPQDCVDIVVLGNKSIEVKTFTSKKGKLLFFPEQSFESVTIKLAAAGRKTRKAITREDLCVNSSQWYSLEVTVDRKATYHQCTFKTDYCSGKCGWVRDYAIDHFESFSVEVHGVSFWSLNITQETQCTTPVFTHTTPATSTTPITVWLACVGGGAVVVAAVVLTVACTVARRMQPLRKRSGRQQLDIEGPVISSQNLGCSNNILHDPTDGLQDTAAGTMMWRREDVRKCPPVPSHPPPPPPTDYASTHNRDSPIYVDVF